MYDVTKEDILKLFDYDREKGVLIWRDNPNKHLVGKVAGYKARNTTNITFHWRIGSNRLFGKDKHVPLHRIIYFLEHGEWCIDIDHIDGDGLNNHYSNLRKGSNGVNNRNTVRRKPKKNSEGLPKGVFRTKFSNRKQLYHYQSKGTYERKIERLYSGFDMFEAICARKSWENKHLRLGNFTERHFER